DGCAPDCTIESGWTCTGQPSVCSSVCGDGVLGAGEECDGGANNGTPGSCCTTACQLQPEGHACDDGDVCTSSDVCHAGQCVGLSTFPPTYVVNTQADGLDATPFDAVCETSPGNGLCTLRAALNEAFSDSFITLFACGATIAVPAGVYHLTVVDPQ